MKNKRKKKQNKSKSKILLLVVLLVLIIGVVIFFQTRTKLQVITVVSNIDDYNYYLESNATKVYKKYYDELKKELKDKKIDEEKYASLIVKLFLIDYYTLNNKVTNKDIGGTQFLHSNLQDKFIKESSESIYKYVENNLYGKRKQELPEVKDVEIKNIEKIIYEQKDYKDDSGYKLEAKITYKKDLKYPKEVNITLIHENNKLVIVEIN